MAKKEKEQKDSGNKQDKKSKPARRKMSFRSKLLFLIFAAASIYFLRQGVLLLLVGIIPSCVAFLVDTTPHRSWTKTVFCFNISGLLPFLVEIAVGGNSQAAVQAMMGDPFTWFIAYSGAGVGWIVIWLCPRVIEKFLVLYYRSCVERHQGKIRKLDAEWGISATSAE